MSRWLVEFLKGMLKCAVICGIIGVPLFIAAGPFAFVFLAMAGGSTAFVLTGIAAVWALGRGNAIQLFGTLCFLPLAYLSYAGVQNYTIWRTELAVDERYLSRIVEHPVGQLDTLVMHDAYCSSDCAEILVNGLAKRVIVYVPHIWEKTYGIAVYGIAPDATCRPVLDEADPSQKLQINGVFDACIFREKKEEIANLTGDISEGVLIKTEWDAARESPNTIVRRYGPQHVALAYRISSGKIGEEYVRWEYDYDGKRKRRTGTEFSLHDFVRALTGVTSDRFGEALRRSPSEAIDAVHRTVGRVPINGIAVRRYFEKLKEKRDRKAPWKLDPEHRQKLSEIGQWACGKSQDVAGCERVFASFFQGIFPD